MARSEGRPRSEDEYVAVTAREVNEPERDCSVPSHLIPSNNSAGVYMAQCAMYADIERRTDRRKRDVCATQIENN